MRPLIAILFLTASLAAAKPAFATTIVDTGAGSFGGGIQLMNINGSVQWVAAEFNVSQAWTITDVQGWIDPQITGSVRFRLYTDGGDVPGIALFDESQTIPGAGANAWYGPSGLSWLIGPGSYW
jgi:hypothetical protein